jgi:hypothetical protein
MVLLVDGLWQNHHLSAEELIQKIKSDIMAFTIVQLQFADLTRWL